MIQIIEANGSEKEFLAGLLVKVPAADVGI